MKPLFVRPLTDAEREQLQAGLRSPSAFTLRRCQCLLASAAGQTPAAIAATYGGSDQTVRNLLRDFAARGAACLTPRPRGPRPPGRGRATPTSGRWLTSPRGRSASRRACGPSTCWRPSATRRAGPTGR